MANFQYSYNRSYLLSSNELQNASKNQLIKEARRLQKLINRRYEQIEKRGYTSSAYEKMRIQQQVIKAGTGYEENVTGVSKNFTHEQLEDIIRSFDSFLSKSTSTYKGIENLQKAEQQQELTPRQSEFKQRVIDRMGRDFNTPEWSRINYIMENDYYNELADLFVNSEEIFNLITSSGYSPMTIYDNIVNVFQDTDGELPSLEELQRIIFGDIED